MSGGGVFDGDGNIIGIHRSQTAVELASGKVSAGYIQDRLHTLGWLPDALEEISETSAFMIEQIKMSTRRQTILVRPNAL
jgi:hypothetical protein